MEVIFVSADSRSRGTLRLYKNGQYIFKAPCFLGKNGISAHKREGDLKTPSGIFEITAAFGIAENPGTALKYIRIAPDTLLCDDPLSENYNKIINSASESGEKMFEYKTEYLYGAVIGYNTECVPYRGSGIFLHCSAGVPTSGCVAVEKELLVLILKKLTKNSVIIIN